MTSSQAASKKNISGELLDAVAAISSKENVQTIARETARQMVIFTHATCCAISKWDRENDILVTWAEYDVSGKVSLAEPLKPYMLSDFPMKKKVLETSTPAQIRFDDPGINDTVRTWMKKGKIKSLFISPLQARGQIIGVIELYDTLQSRQFSQDEITLLELLGKHAGIVLERAEILDEARQRTAELEAVWHARLSQTTSLELEDVLNAILESTLSLFSDVKDAHIFLYDQEVLSFGAAMWADGSVGEPVAMPRKNGATYTVARSGEWLVIPDIKKHPLFAGAPDDWEGAQISMPLSTSGRVVGVMNIWFQASRAFSEDVLRVLKLLGDQAAVAISRAEILAEARQKTAELEAIWQASLVRTTSLELEDVLTAILESTLGIYSDAQNAHVFLYDHDVLSFGAALWPEGRAGEPVAMPRKKGVTYSVAQTGELLVVPDMKTHPLFVDAPKEWKGALIGVPLSVGEQVVGVMNIAYSTPQKFPEDTLRVIRLLGDQAAVAISRARYLQEARQLNAELEAIRQASLSLTSSLNFEEIIAVVLDSALKFSEDALEAYLYTYEEGVLSFASARWSDGRKHEPMLESQENSLTKTVAQTGEVHAITNLPLDQAYDSISDPQVTYLRLPLEKNGEQGSGSKTVIGLPLKTGKRVVGVMNVVYKTPHGFSEAALRMLGLLSDQAALAITNAKLHDIVSHQAKTDPLTGISNRRTMQERLDLEYNRTQRTGKPFTCIIGDIDRFKRVNDTYGHDCGDYVIITVADLIQQTIRAVDLVARWGGEEFCILLPEADRKEADILLKRICMKLSNNVFSWEHHTFSVTMTFGMTSHNQGDQIKDTLRRADEALYQGKEAGRNQIVFIP
ncbi:MAG: GAF domain-containing protein [Anaerolineaceae bacterium]|nr:GAF domain-containing protein [Anaerolineaceae bacterium]